jgi:SAM-dependent methyltransferase
MRPLPFGYSQVDELLGEREQEATKRFYDLTADRYFTLTKGVVRLPPHLSDMLFGGSTEGQLLLDVGCGFGSFYEETPKHLRYIGVDSSEKLVSIGRATYPAADLRIGDICELDRYVSESADYFFASMVLGHLPRSRVEDALKALSKCLKPGAKGFIVSYYTDRSYFLTRDDLDVGFELPKDAGLIQGGFDEESLYNQLTNAGLVMQNTEPLHEQGIMYVLVTK